MAKRNTADCPRRDKGSYRHMLDFVSAANFREVMNDLLQGTDARLAEEDHRHPLGRTKKRDWTELELEDYLKQHPVPGYKGLDRRWWIAFKGSRPTWDLICHVEIGGVPTILVYLGWIASPDWPDDPFADESAWDEAMKSHFTRVGPWEFVGSKQQHPSGASFQMIVRSISPDILS